MARHLTRDEWVPFAIWLLGGLAALQGLRHLTQEPRDTGLGIGEISFGVIVGVFVLVARARNWFGWPSRRKR